mmetsp:Transcript_16308/g.26470  ORF Transcript_16308/g.26470 Transcript_16308/m.26470 type:complete len:159 (-) Transcript_16308:57-533(-)
MTQQQLRSLFEFVASRSSSCRFRQQSSSSTNLGSERPQRCKSAASWTRWERSVRPSSSYLLQLDLCSSPETAGRLARHFVCMAMRSTKTKQNGDTKAPGNHAAPGKTVRQTFTGHHKLQKPEAVFQDEMLARNLSCCGKPRSARSLGCPWSTTATMSG